MNMLITVGENTARECGITREESDDWSYHSNIRAVAATDDGRFAEEIVPVTVPAGRGETVTVSVDEHPRRDTTPEKLAALPLAHRARRPGHRRELLGHRRRGRRPRAWCPAPTPRPTGWSRWRRCGRGTPAGSSRPAPGWRRPSASPGP